MTPMMMLLKKVSAQSLTVSDDFNRANANLSGNWTTLTGNNPLKILSNGVTGSTSNNVSYWSANTFADNQWVQVTMLTGSVYAGLALRCQTGADSYYQIRWDPGSTVIRVYKITAGSLGNPSGGAASWASSFTNGDVLRAEISGTTITVKKNGVTVGSITDTSFASGYPGMWVLNNTFTTTMDDFSAGDL